MLDCKLIEVLRNVEGEYRHEPYVGIGRSSGEVRMQQECYDVQFALRCMNGFLYTAEIMQTERSMTSSTVKGVRSS